MHDIVYILKNEITTDELKYSIRSVEKNFIDRRNIWFAGGKPVGIEPDHYLHINQTGSNKWQKVSNTLKIICTTPEISENFWLFNDDFFIMHPIAEIPAAVDGTMNKRIKELIQKNNLSNYAKELLATKRALENRGYDTLNYALHIPMLINKEKALNTLYEFPYNPMFRCLYGNMYNTAQVVMPDVKIYLENITPKSNEILLSTSDKSWTYGKVGEYIRKHFPEKSSYET